MANRFERGYVAPQPPARRTSGGVVVGPNEAAEKETNLLPLAGALYNVITKQSLYTVTDTDWNTTANFLVAPTGQALSRTGESELYARIGVTWGVGDGVNTFDVPNLEAPNDPPFVVSKSPTYTTVGVYGSGQFAAHSHSLSDGNIQSFFYNGSGPNDQKGNLNTNPPPQAITSHNGNPYQQPNSVRIRQYMATVDGEYELPIGYIIGHLTPMSQIATVLDEFPNLLVCSGQTISPFDFPTYASVYGSTIPNLQGRCIRNEVHGVNIPSNTNFQNSGTTHLEHRHFYNAPPGRLSTPGSYSQERRARNPDGAGGPAAAASGSHFGGATVAPFGIGPGSETRPYNASVTYLIKVA